MWGMFSTSVGEAGRGHILLLPTSLQAREDFPKDAKRVGYLHARAWGI